MKTLFFFIGIFVGFCFFKALGPVYPFFSIILFLSCPFLLCFIGGIKESNKKAKLKREAEYKRICENTKRIYEENKRKEERFYPDIISNISLSKTLQKLDGVQEVLSASKIRELHSSREINFVKNEQEKCDLITLQDCVNSWDLHSNSSLKHKYFYDYYPYRIYKDNASTNMWKSWKIVWNFKNDPQKNISNSDHSSALKDVIAKVEYTLRSTFKFKTKYLTFVCLTASTQRKTDLRFKEFANKVCTDLNMINAYDHIKVSVEGTAKHEGGSRTCEKSYDSSFFRDKYVVLFDDVRTSGKSIEEERQTLESFGAKILCVITIAQTKYLQS